mgnify:CR=1 FL=1
MSESKFKHRYGFGICPDEELKFKTSAELKELLADIEATKGDARVDKRLAFNSIALESFLPLTEAYEAAIKRENDVRQILTIADEERDAAIKERDQLKAQLEAEKSASYYNAYAGEKEKNLILQAQLSIAREALEKDKARLDWLNNQRVYLGFNGHGNRVLRCYGVDTPHDFHAKELRQAIDDAMKGNQ